MPIYYLRIEAVNLDNSVYDTHDISTIRGGSFILLNAVNQFKKINGKPLEDIGSAASIGFYKFDAKDDTDAEIIRKKALDVLKAKDGEFATESFATYVSAVEPAGAEKDFHNVVQWLTIKSRWQQYQQPTLVLPSETDKDKECFFDGVRPAVGMIPKGQEEKPASQAVMIRHTEGIILRNKLYHKLIGINNVKFTGDLENLTTRNGSLSGKIAFIHFDGNRFSTIRDKLCRSETDMKTFQGKAQNSRDNALKKILETATNPANKSFRTEEVKVKVRLETLMWGGDEIEFVVPAWQAMNLLQDFFDVIQKTEKIQGVQLTYSAGVLFCHHNLPILQVRKYAEQLCALAKKDIPKNIHELDAKHNRFAFLDMSAFDLVKGDIRRFLTEYHSPAKIEEFVIPAQELNALIKNLLVIKRKFPRNKLYDIIHALKKKDLPRVNDIQERVFKLIKDKNCEETVHTITKGNPNRWFLISDLLPYVGEDDHE